MWIKNTRKIDEAGKRVDGLLGTLGVGLFMGGEPTFISRNWRDREEWQTEALGSEKEIIALRLQKRLADRFSSGGILHYGPGKLYQGEDSPRFAYGCVWRSDGVPVWKDPRLFCSPHKSFRKIGTAEMEVYTVTLAVALGVPVGCILPAREKGKRKTSALILPLRRRLKRGGLVWESCRWPSGGKGTVLLPGTSPAGLRLPLNDLSFDEEAISVALLTEIREGILYVFCPPLGSARDYLELVSSLEESAASTGIPVRIEGYIPSHDPLLNVFHITPDPGVLEVNVQPAGSWEELGKIIGSVFGEGEKENLTALRSFKNGRLGGTGGGCHVTLGGSSPGESPFSRNPGLLSSLLSYWQAHPGLSYLFPGLFVGSSSQAPRADEAHPEAILDMELALRHIPSAGKEGLKELSRLYRALLTDPTGNSHRSEFCIDKLVSDTDPWRSWGVLEFRGFEMPPSKEMAMILFLLIRSLVALLWDTPFREKPVEWGRRLQDRFYLPYFIEKDLKYVVSDLRKGGIPFEFSWLCPLLSFRYPVYGKVGEEWGYELELRQAIESWPVLGDAALSGRPSRPIDYSCDRLQVKVMSREKNLAVLCNGFRLPLEKIGKNRYVGGVRYKAHQIDRGIHPYLPVAAPLRIDLVDTLELRSRGGCIYHVERPDGGVYIDFPADLREAARRREERFFVFPPLRKVPTISEPSRYDRSLTLDLRLE